MAAFTLPSVGNGFCGTVRVGGHALLLPTYVPVDAQPCLMAESLLQRLGGGIHVLDIV
jgi:hypothetical protein